MSKVLYEKRDRIAYVTINRPEARNAIDPDVHRLMIETWADFRDDDSVDVAILTGARRGLLRRRRPEDLHPADHRRRRRPTTSARSSSSGLERLHPRHAPDLQADHRRDQRLGARRRPGDGAGLRHPDRLRARDVRLVRGAARLPPRRRRHRAPRQHLRRRRRAARCCSPPSRSTPSGRCSATWSRKVVPHDDLMEEAELVAQPDPAQLPGARCARRSRRSST